MKVIKVVNIEIANQVFWVDDKAFKQVQNYLKTIKRQLKNDTAKNDIYKDIELRIAELLFVFNSNDKKAITDDEINRVIQQVGYLESDEEALSVDDRSLTNRRNAPKFLKNTFFVLFLILTLLVSSIFLEMTANEIIPSLTLSVIGFTAYCLIAYGWVHFIGQYYAKKPFFDFNKTHQVISAVLFSILIIALLSIAG